MQTEPAPFAPGTWYDNDAAPRRVPATAAEEEFHVATTNGRAEILRAARITIAQEAGLSLSALYYYFPSKQDALFELIHNAFTWFSARAQEAVETTGPDPVDRIAALVRFTVRYRSTYRQVSRVILRDTERLSQESFTTIRGLQRESRDIFVGVVQQGRDSGVFHVDNADIASRAILSIINSIPLWFSKDGTLTIDQLEEQYTRFSLRLLGLDPSDAEIERLIALPLPAIDGAVGDPDAEVAAASR
jgi:AcrR family transcriptional regulator